MWSKEVSIKINAAREEVWKLWTDVPNWNTWDEQVISSNLDGDFKIGQIGELIPKGGPKSSYELVEVTPYKSFTSRSKLPLTKMDFIHEMKEVDGILILTHKVRITGVLSFLFSRIIGSKMVKELPHAMNKLSNMAQKKEI